MSDAVGLYSRLYSTKPEYKMGIARLAECAELLSRDAGRGLLLLDVGCGRGEFLGEANAYGYAAVGCDPAGAVLGCAAAALPRLPYLIGAFDYVTCFDVLEHIEEAQTEECIRELVRVASERVLITVAWCSDVRDGAELHITRHPLDWWVDAVVSAVGIVPDSWLSRRANAGVVDIDVARSR